jgi:hypothetical protein
MREDRRERGADVGGSGHGEGGTQRNLSTEGLKGT